MGFFIWIYLIVLALVATKLGYVMRTKLDEFDWRFNKGRIWQSYILVLLFWPIVLLFSPRSLFVGDELFVYDMMFGDLRIQSIAQRMRSLKQMADSPDPCGNTIYFTHQPVDDRTGKGVRQWFEAEDLVMLYKGKTLPLYSDYESAALVSWVKNRDQSIEQPTEVPKQINFQNVAVSLLDAGYGHIECKVCATRYRASELSREEPPLHGGWNEAIYLCPKGHTLLRYSHVHIST